MDGNPVRRAFPEAFMNLERQQGMMKRELAVFCALNMHWVYSFITVLCQSGRLWRLVDYLGYIILFIDERDLGSKDP